jgi:hypothetical protein
LYLSYLIKFRLPVASQGFGAGKTCLGLNILDEVNSNNEVLSQLQKVDQDDLANFQNAQLITVDLSDQRMDQFSNFAEFLCVSMGNQLKIPKQQSLQMGIASLMVSGTNTSYSLLLTFTN